MEDKSAKADRLPMSLNRDKSLSLSSITVPSFSTPTAEAKSNTKLVREGNPDNLLRKIQIFLRYRRAEKESETDAGNAQGGVKQGRTAIPNPEDIFPYSNTLFTKSNTPALRHVTYLMLHTAFPREAVIRFADSWQFTLHGDKKAESTYRRTAFRWVEEIAETYPTYFNDIKPQFTLFIVPTGNRCVLLLECLAEAVMFILAERISKNDGVDLKTTLEFKGVPGSDAERVHAEKLNKMLDTKKREIREMEMEKNMLEKWHKEIMKKCEEYGSQLESDLGESESKLLEIIKEQPALFPENALDMIRSPSRFCLENGEDFEPDVLLKNPDIEVTDKLAEGIKEKWRKELIELRQMYEYVQAMVEKFEVTKRLTEEVQENCHFVIDAKKYPSIFGNGSDDCPKDMTDVCEQLISRITAFTKLYPSDEVLLEKMPDLESRVCKLEADVKQLTDDLSEAINTLSDIPFTPKDLEFMYKANLAKLEGTDWSKLIPYPTEALDLEIALKFTPPKSRNFTRPTGITPQLSIVPPDPTETKVDRLKKSIHLSASFDKTKLNVHPHDKSVRFVVSDLEKSLDSDLDFTLNPNRDGENLNDTQEFEDGIADTSDYLVLSSPEDFL